MKIRGEIWKQYGRCRGKNQSIFFPEHKGNSTERLAKKICEECPVRVLCYRYAMLNEEQGIWGGTNDQERAMHKAMIEMTGFTVPQYLQQVVPPPVEVELNFSVG